VETIAEIAANSVGASVYSNPVTLTPPPSHVTPPPFIPTPPPTPWVPESITVFGKSYHVWATGLNTPTNITRSIQTNFVEERFALLAGASTSTPDPSAYLLDVLTDNGVTPARPSRRKKPAPGLRSMPTWEFFRQPPAPHPQSRWRTP